MGLSDLIDNRTRRGEAYRPRVKGPRLLTPEVWNAVMNGRRKMLNDSHCAGLARIPVSTLAKWLIQGRQEYSMWAHDAEDAEDQNETPREPSLLTRFVMDWEYHFSVAVMQASGRMEKAAIDDPRAWGADATRLERADPDFFGKRKSIEVNQKVEIEYKIHRLNGEDWQKRQIGHGPTLDTTFLPGGESDAGGA